MRRAALTIIIVCIFAQSCLAGDSFFGDRELTLSVGNIKQWNACLKRGPNIMKAFEGHEVEETWLQFVNIAKRVDRVTQAFFVTCFFNKWPYVKDSEGKFLTPQEFVAQHGGDCEDYAIIKMYALELLGFSQEDMRVCVYVMEDGVHANLVVTIDGERYVLDNSFDSLAPVSEITERPRYSFNANNLFFHLK